MDAGHNTVIWKRVSTEEQTHGTSLGVQGTWGKKVVEDRNLRLLDEIEEDLSGQEAPKRIIELISRQKEPVHCLLAMRVDRLARKILPALGLIQFLVERNILVITQSQEYNLQKLPDLLAFLLQLMVSQSEFDTREARTKEAYETFVTSGSTPYPPAPGYAKDASGVLYPLPEWRQPLRDLFEDFVREESYTEALERFNNRYESSLGRLSPSQVRAMIRNPIYVGRQAIAGICYYHPHLAVVNQELFEAAQNVAQKIKDRHRGKSRDSLPPVVKEFIDKYGLAGRHLLKNLHPGCSKCDSTDVTDNGQKPVGDAIVYQFICRSCKKNKDGRDYFFEFPSRTQLQGMQSFSPTYCRGCSSADSFMNDQALGPFHKLRLRSRTCKVCLALNVIPDEEEAAAKRKHKTRPRKKRSGKGSSRNTAGLKQLSSAS